MAITVALVLFKSYSREKESSILLVSAVEIELSNTNCYLPNICMTWSARLVRKFELTLKETNLGLPSALFRHLKILCLSVEYGTTELWC